MNDRTQRITQTRALNTGDKFRLLDTGSAKLHRFTVGRDYTVRAIDDFKILAIGDDGSVSGWRYRQSELPPLVEKI